MELGDVVDFLHASFMIIVLMLVIPFVFTKRVVRFLNE